MIRSVIQNFSLPFPTLPSPHSFGQFRKIKWLYLKNSRNFYYVYFHKAGIGEKLSNNLKWRRIVSLGEKLLIFKWRIRSNFHLELDFRAVSII